MTIPFSVSFVRFITTNRRLDLQKNRVSFFFYPVGGDFTSRSEDIRSVLVKLTVNGTFLRPLVLQSLYSYSLCLPLDTIGPSTKFVSLGSLDRGRRSFDSEISDSLCLLTTPFH